MNKETKARRMIFRFSLYGFLKNQQYYDPFLFLALMEKGLDFFAIGLLFGIRELVANVCEIPSGAVADLYGRRASMILSFVAYILSFAVLGASASFWQLALAMAFFGVGQAFRTGTHKAMIFDWLRAEGREPERVRVYGYTRSWSKIGSAVSSLIAAGLVFALGQYSYVFYLCIIPYAINILNFLGYPPQVEGPRDKSSRRLHVFGQVAEALRQAWTHRTQRRLLLEAMGYESAFKVSKDYLQPVLEKAALGLPLLLGLADKQRTALLVGFVYCGTYLLSSAASRQAHRVVAWGGQDEAAAGRMLWRGALAGYALLIPALFFQIFYVAILLFILIYTLQNFWRPALVSRLNACSDAAFGATTLSIESQGTSLMVMVLAPAAGWVADTFGIWTVGATGALIALAALATEAKRRAPASCAE